jgi:hypothetical protein
VAVKAKTCSRRNLVVIPDDQRAKRLIGRIFGRPYCKVALSLEPTKIAAIERR